MSAKQTPIEIKENPFIFVEAVAR